jgi:hypothetical protein
MKKINKIKLSDSSNDLQFWLSKSITERLQALEDLRFRYLKYFKNESERRLQRVCSIVKQK